MSTKIIESTKNRIIVFTALLLCIAIIFGCVYFFFFRKTPFGSLYTFKNNLEFSNASDEVARAQAINDALENIKYTYSYTVTYENADNSYKFGTENIISLTGRGTENAKGHRLNTYTSVKEGTLQQSKSENFYYSDGNIYAKRFNQNYWSQMSEKDFITYTQYSEYSLSPDFLNEIFFTEATVYSCLNDTTEIAFTEANQSLINGIASYIGLDQTSFKYSVNDTALTVIIDTDGKISEKHLTFTVDYYSEDAPDNIVTYSGDFAYILNSTSDIEVTERNKADNYQQISNIALLSSITETGYTILFTQPGVDITYNKTVTLKDADNNEYFYIGSGDIAVLSRGDALHYSSIITEKYQKDELVHNTVGLFINENGYTEKVYDYQKSEITSSLDNSAHDYTNEEITQAVMSAVAGERIFESEIYSVATLSEDAETVTYSVTLTSAANKSFASYLIDTFSESSDSFDTSQFGFSSTKCEVTITVRKSDGCILYQLFDYSARLYNTTGSGSITVEGRCEMRVNQTGSDITLSTPDDWSTAVESNKSTQ